MDCLALWLNLEKGSNYKYQFSTKVCLYKDVLLRHAREKHKNEETDLSDSRRGTTNTLWNSKFKKTELINIYVKNEEKLCKD